LANSRDLRLSRIFRGAENTGAVALWQICGTDRDQCSPPIQPDHRMPRPKGEHFCPLWFNKPKKSKKIKSALRFSSQNTAKSREVDANCVFVIHFIGRIGAPKT
jgi:hypothetical protein